MIGNRYWRSSAIPKSVLLYVIYVFSATAYADLEYSVKKVAANTHDLELSLQLPQKMGQSEYRLAVRGHSWGLQEQVRSPQCANKALSKDKEGYWIAPKGCTRVSWGVNIPAVQDGVTDVSLQTSVMLAKPGWILFSEPTSLLRVVGMPPQGSLLRAADDNTKLLGATRRDDQAWRVPPDNNAPEFYIIGKPDIQTRNVGDFQVSHVMDNQQRVAQLSLIEKHSVVLRYLSQIIYQDATVPLNDRALLVVWIGIDEQHGHAGGAAGSRSFLANYLVGDKEKSTRNTAATLMILAHEQFHQLVDASRAEMPALPGWINESLAQYYGLRAMQLALSNNDIAQYFVRQFIDHNRVVEYKFAGSEDIFVKNRSLALDLAYRQGATFWAELDKALRLMSNGGRSLDEYIPQLLRMTFPDDGTLPRPFLKQLRNLKDPVIEQVISKYVGTPE